MGPGDVHGGQLIGPRAKQEAGGGFRRMGGGGKPDALHGGGRVRLQAFERQREQRPALAFGEGVKLVDDHRLRREASAPGGLREQRGEAFGSREQQVRAAASESAAFRRLGVARPDGHADAEPVEQGREVAVNVAGQRFQGRDVDGQRLIGESVCAGAAGQPLEQGGESGQGFAGTSGRENQHMTPGAGERQRARLDGRERGIGDHRSDCS